ncbi:MAG: hypothetical protein N3E45_02765 [Oscillatoriaceae bacterium SKW80]|nr:hypothetical protein [Oscillatoriaceae bacterium SKYG93]MCX8119744.1 hypothetical protein [Oscillatoriaceae bacterium SKW80]MDW8452379.1 hypothetical protein [Oscillatoriaceae cyanobacterium SKYGB_i_bin93]
MRILGCLFLVLALLLTGAAHARAGALTERIANFPRWQGLPPVAVAKGDLIYPGWMAGDWEVTSTLVELVAPLAPELVTPGFESNRKYLNQPVRFRIRFIKKKAVQVASAGGAVFLKLKRDKISEDKPLVVADRSFNGLNIARSYLGESAVIAVKVDPDNPNRQITLLPEERQLVSTVTLRGSETPKPNLFLATEVIQQEFRSRAGIYFNQVETTTAYQYAPGSAVPIHASQMTAVYLSPQEPAYFKALGRPVALYRYELDFSPVSAPAR